MKTPLQRYLVYDFAYGSYYCVTSHDPARLRRRLGPAMEFCTIREQTDCLYLKVQHSREIREAILKAHKEVLT